MKKLIGLVYGLVWLAGPVFSQSPNGNAEAGPAAVVNANAGNFRQDDDDPVRSKTFTKSFAADQSDKLMLSNQYGSMQVKIWNKREVQADIDIKAYANSEDEAQKLLDDVTIDAGKNGDQISFKTHLNQQNSSWGRGNRRGRKWRREVRINYVVYMPAALALTLSQSYGSVTLGDLTGALYAKVQYGNFTAQNLANVSNYISVQYGNTNIQNLNAATIKQQYGSGLNIGTINTLDLNAQYSNVKIGTIKGSATVKQQYGSGLTIGTVEDLNLNAQYVNVNVTSIRGNAKIDQQYNNLTIGNVGRLDLKSQYTGASIGTLSGDGTFDMDYNKLTIDEITSGAKSVAVEGQYVSISLGFTANYNADFSVHTSYASFKYGDKVTARLLTDTKNYSSTKDYDGKIGNGGTALVKIKSGYGSVNFK